MIKGDPVRKIIPPEYTRCPCVIAGRRLSFRTRDKDRRNRVVPRISFRIGVRVELPDEFDIEAGFFAGLAHGG